MAEKVIFEFRSERDEGGHYQYEFRCGGEAFTLSGLPFQGPCCPIPGAWMRGAKWTHQGKERSRRHMRETLDFFEQMYDDLYGKEDKP